MSINKFIVLENAYSFFFVHSLSPTISVLILISSGIQMIIDSQFFASISRIICLIYQILIIQWPLSNTRTLIEERWRISRRKVIFLQVIVNLTFLISNIHDSIIFFTGNLSLLFPVDAARSAMLDESGETSDDSDELRPRALDVEEIVEGLNDATARARKKLHDDTHIYTLTEQVVFIYGIHECFENLERELLRGNSPAYSTTARRLRRIPYSYRSSHSLRLPRLRYHQLWSSLQCCSREFCRCIRLLSSHTHLPDQHACSTTSDRFLSTTVSRRLYLSIAEYS